MQIKTLAQILAESDTDSASSAESKKTSKHRSPNSKSATKTKLTQTELFNRRKSKKAQRTQRNFFENNSDIDNYPDTDSTDESRSDFFSDDVSQPIPSIAKSKTKKRKKRFHPAATFIAKPSDTPTYTPPKSQSIQQMLAEVKRNVHQTDSSDTLEEEGSKEDDRHSSPLKPKDDIDHLTASEIDNLPSALKSYLRTPQQKQAEIDAIKAESRLRWLAFYYLSRREYGKAELKQKLIDKEQDPDKIDALLDEFEDKGYQSDYRTTLMLIRENIRKGRGRGRIKQEFYKKKITMPSNIDELIEMANSESEEFSEFIDESTDSLVEGIDWLKLAVEARIKKYGNDIPVDQKDKAKQLRFLQYRGFKSDVCFNALNYNLDSLDERF